MQATRISTTATVTDVDSANFDGGRLKVRLTANPQTTDRITLRNVGNITVVGNEVRFAGIPIGTFVVGSNYRPLVVTLNSQANPLRVQALLRSVAFFNTSTNPSAKPRTVAAQVLDGDGGLSFESSKQILVTPVAGAVGNRRDASGVLLASTFSNPAAGSTTATKRPAGVVSTEDETGSDDAVVVDALFTEIAAGAVPLF